MGKRRSGDHRYPATSSVSRGLTLHSFRTQNKETKMRVERKTTISLIDLSMDEAELIVSALDQTRKECVDGKEFVRLKNEITKVIDFGKG